MSKQTALGVNKDRYSQVWEERKKKSKTTITKDRRNNQAISLISHVVHPSDGVGSLHIPIYRVLCTPLDDGLSKAVLHGGFGRCCACRVTPKRTTAVLRFIAPYEIP